MVQDKYKKCIRTLGVLVILLSVISVNSVSALSTDAISNQDGKSLPQTNNKETQRGLENMTQSDSGTSATGIDGPPAYSITDVTGVNLVSGKRVVTQKDLSIGNGDLLLSHTFASYKDYFDGFWDDFNGYYTPGSSRTKFKFGHSVSLGFNANGDSIQGDGSTFYEDGDKVVFVDRSGTEYKYEYVGYFDRYRLLTQISYPNGFTVDIGHLTSDILPVYRLEWVRSNNGLQFRYLYKNNDNPNSNDESRLFGPDLDNKTADWQNPSSLVALNNAIEVCLGEYSSCSINKAWPTVSYNWADRDDLYDAKTTIFEVILPDGSTLKYQQIGQYNSRVNADDFYFPVITAVKETSSPNNFTSIYKYSRVYVDSNGSFAGYRLDNVADKSTIYGSDWTYDFPEDTYGMAHYSAENSSSGPNGTLTVSMVRYYGVPGKIEQPDGTIIFLTEDNKNRVDRVTYPEGNRVKFYYDDRGNLTKREARPKTDSEQGILVLEAGFDLICNNLKTCNKPNWIKDANGNITDFTYHPQSGLIASVTKPANKDGIRPQVRYTYEKMFATYIEEDGGQKVDSESGIWQLKRESYCRNGKSQDDGTCELTNDEVVKTYYYDSDNLWLTGVKIEAEIENETLLTCYEYDIYGNQIGLTSPLGNDTTCL